MVITGELLDGIELPIYQVNETKGHVNNNLHNITGWRGFYSLVTT